MTTRFRCAPSALEATRSTTTNEEEEKTPIGKRLVSFLTIPRRAGQERDRDKRNEESKGNSSSTKNKIEWKPSSCDGSDAKSRRRRQRYLAKQRAQDDE